MQPTEIDSDVDLAVVAGRVMLDQPSLRAIIGDKIANAWISWAADWHEKSTKTRRAAAGITSENKKALANTSVYLSAQLFAEVTGISDLPEAEQTHIFREKILAKAKSCTPGTPEHGFEVTQGGRYIVQ